MVVPVDVNTITYMSEKHMEEKELEDGEIDDLEDGEIEDDDKEIEEVLTAFLGDVRATVKSSNKPHINENNTRRDENTNTYNYPRNRGGFGVGRERGRGGGSYGFNNVGSKPYIPRGSYQTRGRSSYSPRGRGARGRGHGPWSHPPRHNTIQDKFPQVKKHEEPRKQEEPRKHVEEPRKHVEEPKLDIVPSFASNTPDISVDVEPIKDIEKDPEEWDDYDLLLERHKLIQQQLDLLVKAEKDNKNDDNWSDDETFVTIPLQDATNELSASQEKLGNVVAMNEPVFDADNKLYDDLSSEDGTAFEPKKFEPFKIKPLYKSLPSLQERSKLDLKVRGISENEEITEGGAEASKQLQRKDKKLNLRRSRRKRQKVTKKLCKLMDKNLKSPSPDVHAELESQLVLTADVGTQEQQNASSSNILQKRKERLKAWQEKHKQEMLLENISPDGDVTQGQQHKKRTRRKTSKTKRRKSAIRTLSQEQDVDTNETESYQRDDYLIRPMEVESDSTDGVSSVPPLPTIETEEQKPPPPPDFIQDGNLTTATYREGSNSHQPFWSSSIPVGGYTLFDQQDQSFDWMSSLPSITIPPGQLADSGDTVFFPKVSEDSQNEGTQEEEDEDDDEDAMREQLLKTMAMKRAAKKAVLKDTMSSDNSVTPQDRSPVVERNNQTATPPHPGSATSQPSRMLLEVPRHEPVVININADSDDSDEEHDKHASKVSGSSEMKSSLFSGLEDMIKAARIASGTVKKKKRESVSRTSSLSVPVPKTPDALAHLPEHSRAEYRRLKEEIASRERKKKQQPNNNKKPLSDKGEKPKSEQSNKEKVTDDETKTQETEATDDKAPAKKPGGIKQNLEDPRITSLKSKILENDAKLFRHKKSLVKEHELLSLAEKNLKTRKTRLVNLETKVRELQDQLQAAEDLASKSHSFVERLGKQVEAIHDRVSKKQRDSSELEEEVLRAKTLLTRSNHAKKKPPSDAAKTEQEEARNSLLLATEKVLVSLEEKGKKLDQYLDSNASKRKATDDADSTKATKKQALQSSKSAHQIRAERIATEKLRLQKIEKDLSDRLRQYGRHLNVSSSPASSISSPRKQIINEPTGTESEGAETSTEVDMKQKSDEPKQDEIQQDVVLESTPMEDVTHENKGPQASGGEEAKDVELTEARLKLAQKLQSEKEENGPGFPAIPVSVIQSITKSAAQYVWLDNELEATPVDPSTVQDENSASQSVKKSVPEMNSEEDLQPVSLGPYKSPLLHFKSYRFSPYYRTRAGLPITSLSFTNKLNPRKPLCNFDLQGVCNDKECFWQHASDLTPDGKTEILLDLASYAAPELAKNSKTSEGVASGVNVYVENFTKQYKGKMSDDEMLLYLVNTVKLQKKLPSPYSIQLCTRQWKPSQSRKRALAPNERTQVFVIEKRHDKQVIGNESRQRKQCEIQSDSKQEVRYFEEHYDTLETLEASIRDHPSDVDLWLRLSAIKASSASNQQAAGQPPLDQALNVLSRALEANKHSEVLWLKYLELFSSRGSDDEVKELCEQAVILTPTYRIWWQYILLTRSYKHRTEICTRLIDYLITVPPLDDKQLHSHQILQTFIYLLQLDLISGHYKIAIQHCQCALSDVSNNTVVFPHIVEHLTPEDLTIAWLAYLHLFEFKSLPETLFDPSCSNPSRIVSKGEIVFPWKVKDGIQSSVTSLLALFHDALKACCSGRLNAPHCLPLYKNLLALDRARGKIDSARNVCKRLLKQRPSCKDLWLCLVALEQMEDNPDETAKVSDEALEACNGDSQVVYMTACCYLEQGQADEALELLTDSVKRNFVLSESESNSEAVQSDLLYRKLLSLSLPYDCVIPPFQEHVDVSQLGEENVYIWLNYCLVLELQGVSKATIDETFESAIHSTLDKKDMQKLWTEYLLYKKRVLQENEKKDKQKEFLDLLHRCLSSVPTSTILPHNPSACWQDYTFHNKVIGLYLSCLPESLWSSALDQFLNWYPKNVQLALQACRHEWKMNNKKHAKKICSTSLNNNPECLMLWKIAISLELCEGSFAEARKHYLEATQRLPLAATLWKDFILFTAAHTDDGDATKEVIRLQKSCQDLGVDIDEFWTTVFR